MALLDREINEGKAGDGYVASERRGLFRGQFRALFEAGTVTGLTDGQLLERFATHRDEASELAFAALVERHGPMVLRACRGVLGNDHDAMDAFQATFLVLANKGGSLWARDSLGPWLHRVACRAAGRARKSAARRKAGEQRAVVMAGPRNSSAADAADRDELAAIIHEEVDRLPERYRAAVVLCDLEGRTCEDAARHLGCPVGTVGSRLARGRDRLRERLTRRGLASGLLAWQAPRDPLPPELVTATAAAAAQFVANQAASQGTAAILALGVLRTMTMTSFWKAATIILALGASTSGVVAIAGKGAGGEPNKPNDPPQAARASATTEVKPGTLSVAFDQPGRLESARNNNVLCELEGQAYIVSILPEGTHVKKGELVCELDINGRPLTDQLTSQKIKTEGAGAARLQAKLTREVAEIALNEYTNGVYPRELSAAAGGIQQAASALKRAEQRIGRTRDALNQLNKLALQTPGDIVIQLDVADRLDDAEEAVSGKQLSLDARQKERDLLEFTREKTVKQLEIDIAKARADESASQTTLARAKAMEEKIESQIAKTKLYAPNDGVVVYANNPDFSRSRGANEPFIDVKALVSERQIIFSVPDLTSLRAVVKIPEASIDQIAPGQSARVSVDAFPGQTLAGVVESVASLPDPPSTVNRGVKVYQVIVTINDGGMKLRPGMTARVEILSRTLDNVLSVPVETLVRYDETYHVAVKQPDGGFDFRPVKLGASNQKQVEIKEGLKAGEEIALDPRPLLSDEQRKKATYPPQEQ